MSILRNTHRVKAAIEYAKKCHAETNHTYDGKPYDVHLQMVDNVASEYLHIVPLEEEPILLAACWAHDVIEDCRQTYNDVQKELGKDVADIVYALTNEKGKNRKERANDKYYAGILDTPFASFVKICDRIANFRYSLSKQSRMANMYSKENDYFKSKLYCNAYKPMFDELDSLCEQAANTMTD